MAPEALTTAEPRNRPATAPSFLAEHTLGLGVALYAAVALADTFMTVKGMGGDLALEGNPIMRAAMETLGVEAGLLVQKIAIGAITALIAHFGAPVIRNRSEWIWKIPMTPPVRRWMQRGDRSWIAYIPLHAAIAAQAFAVASWVALGLSRS
jgi:hypothetical protein